MKKLYIAFVIIFIICLIIPSASMPFFKNAENTEKRELAAFPKLKDENGINSDFGEELDDYLKDHIGFRNELVKADNMIMSGIFGESGVEKVIIGADDWLYFNEDVTDYLNTATISERNALNAAKTYRMVQDKLSEDGRSFIFSVVPNKSSLYGSLPYYYLPLSEDGNYELLMKAFDEAGVTRSDLMKSFKDRDGIYYQQLDTHWTYEGALFAYNEILDAAGFPHESFEGLEFEKRRDWDGDLAVMLYGGSAKKDEQSYPLMDFHYSFTSHETAPDSLLLTTYNEGGSKNALVYRDSYGETMYVFFAEAFNSAAFTRAVPYNISLADKYKADVVVLEIVERNIDNLCFAAPVMEAPQVNINVSAVEVDRNAVKLYTGEKNGLTHYYGEIDRSLLSDDYHVYILLGGNGSKSYEAFPIYEKELLGSEVSGDNGFSAYVAAENTEGRDVSVMIDNGSECYYWTQ